MTRLPAVTLVASALLISCGPFTMPFAEKSRVSVVVAGDPGFVSIGGFGWQVSLIAPSGAAIATVDPSGEASIAVVPGDYRLDISAIPMSDLVMCADPAPPGTGTCTRQEGPARGVCVVPIRVPPVTGIVLSVTVVAGKACQASVTDPPPSGP
jgi:hypothetical protein